MFLRIGDPRVQCQSDDLVGNVKMFHASMQGRKLEMLFTR